MKSIAIIVLSIVSVLSAGFAFLAEREVAILKSQVEECKSNTSGAKEEAMAYRKIANEQKEMAELAVREMEIQMEKYENLLLKCNCRSQK